MAIKTWAEIEAAILAKEPKAAPALAVVQTYWGDGKLTEDTANRYIAAYVNRNFAECQRLMLPSMSAGQIIAADQAENTRLGTLIDNDKRIYDFATDLAAVLLKIGLGIAMAAVGL